jgi:hypothetical protein
MGYFVLRENFRFNFRFRENFRINFHDNFRYFRIFSYNFFAKNENKFSRNFRENSKTKIFVSTLEQGRVYTLGWVDFGLFFTFSTKVPLRFVTYLPEVPKKAKTIFWPVDLFIIGHDFLGHALYKDPKNFPPQYRLHGYPKMQNLHKFQK